MENSDRATYLIDWRNMGGIRGDVNGDGTVGVGDIITITNIMAGEE